MSFLEIEEIFKTILHFTNEETETEEDKVTLIRLYILATYDIPLKKNSKILSCLTLRGSFLCPLPSI